MRSELLVMLDQKLHFILAVEKLLKEDYKRNNVESLRYSVLIYDEEKDLYDEFIDITWSSGRTKRIYAKGNNNGKNLKDIIREVY